MLFLQVRAVLAVAAAVASLVCGITVKPTSSQAVDSPPNDSITSTAPITTTAWGSSNHVSTTEDGTSQHDTSDQQFTCIHEDSISNLYMKRINEKGPVFQCPTGTRCFKNSIEHVGICCTYPESASNLASQHSLESGESLSVSAIDNTFESDKRLARCVSSVYIPMANEERSKALYALPVESPTSSEPRVLSGNVVLPTMAIKITDDAHEPDAATVIIVEPDSSTSIELKIQRAFTLREDYLLAASTTPTPVGDISGFLSPHPPFLGEPPSAMASERHEITIDNDALFSALYQTRPNTQGEGLLSSPPAPIALPTLLPTIVSPAFTVSQPPKISLSQPVIAPLPAILSMPSPVNHLSQSPPNLFLQSQAPLARSQITVGQGNILIPTSSARAVSNAIPPISSIVSANMPSVAVVHTPPISFSLPTPSLQLPSSLGQLSQPMYPPLAASHSMPPALNIPQLIHPPLITVVLHPIIDSVLPSPSLSILSPATSLPPPTLSSVLSLPGLDTSPHITEPSRDISLVNNAAGDELDAIYPQNTPIIPFISDGVRQDVPSQDSDEKGDKGSVNSSGIASILQNIFHVPPEKITIDGRPVLENGMNQLNHGGTIDVTVMDPGNFKGGVLQNNLVKGSKGKDDDDDDDLLDDLDDDLDSEPVTHSLNVDRFRHRKKGNIRLGMSEPQTKDFSTVGVTDDSHSDSDDSDANAYDSDSGSDKDDDEDFELQYATPTKTITHSDNTILSLAPATTRSHRTEVPTSTDTPERITHSTIV